MGDCIAKCVFSKSISKDEIFSFERRKGLLTSFYLNLSKNNTKALIKVSCELIQYIFHFSNKNGYSGPDFI